MFKVSMHFSIISNVEQTKKLIDNVLKTGFVFMDCLTISEEYTIKG